MSDFRNLLKEAHDAGVERMSFDVDARLFFANPEAESWRAGTHLPGPQFLTAHGRTGEEALRKLVELLKAVLGKAVPQ